ncbi:hypothetical protein BDF20DRAFT_546367 [Mycotypha africana]|uniref:uncharacterized protein n=1 Tax=Mycotypha africana TaxID=64632 RepID=UPI0023011F79|nr:uncharacterized protein BDF20DRAFT_546367 [Mycotypha africana]KAI8977126.1 hypothetical protein BDF20DRAFT_546367 [Mycotypha africana]
MSFQQGQKSSHPDLFKAIHDNQETKSYTSRLVAEKDFKNGEVIVQLTGVTPGVAKTYTSVQFSPTTHVELNSDLVYLNHSCDPTTYLDVTDKALVALKDIKKGDDLTFFYPSTEWEMSQPFDCWCGAEKCVGKVAGAKNLPVDVLRLYKLSPHIIQLKSEQ